MHSARALAWLAWQRHRHALIGYAVYFAALAAAVNLCPREWRAADLIAPLTAIPAVAAILHLTAIFVNPDVDLSSPGCGYTPHLLARPISTRDLVRWPMLYGSASVALTWLLVAGLILRPAGIHAPIVWPAAMVALLCALLQALFWTPVRVPLLRAGVAAALVPGTLIVTTFIALSGTSQYVLLGFDAVVVLAAYHLALRGLAAGRCGAWLSASGVEAVRNQHEGTRPGRQEGTGRRPFPTPVVHASAHVAQMWLEWRRNGLILPIAVFAVCILFGALGLLSRDRVPLLGSEGASGWAGIHLGAGVRAQAFLLLLPVFLAGPIGCGARRTGVGPFMLVRPLSSAEMVGVKLAMAWRCTLLAWAVALPFVALWLLAPASDGARQAPLGALLAHYVTPAGTLSAAALLLALMGLTWKGMVSSLWAELAPGQWIMNAYGVWAGLMASGLMGYGAWLSVHPEMVARLLRAVPALIALAALAKAAVGVALVWLLLRWNIVTSRALLRPAALWLVAGTAAAVAAARLLPPGPIGAPSVALAALLAVPWVRLAAAPLMLHRLRHG